MWNKSDLFLLSLFSNAIFFQLTNRRSNLTQYECPFWFRYKLFSIGFSCKLINYSHRMVNSLRLISFNWEVKAIWLSFVQWKVKLIWTEERQITHNNLYTTIIVRYFEWSFCDCNQSFIHRCQLPLRNQLSACE